MIPVIGIAGGTGSGKSTLALKLAERTPGHYAILHVDDYYKDAKEAPRLGEFMNWDHPDALRFDDMLADLTALKEGKPVEIHTKSELYHPDYDPQQPTRITYTVQPAPAIILEGYLAFHDPRIRNLMDVRIFLSMPIQESIQRRSHNKGRQLDAYFTHVLIPAHTKFVEPSQVYATLVIPVSGKDAETVATEAQTHIKTLLAKREV
jgi:uridine kinase